MAGAWVHSKVTRNATTRLRHPRAKLPPPGREREIGKPVEAERPLPSCVVRPAINSRA
jgi:hypothetical protein